MEGRRFNRWLVIREVKDQRNGKYWLCRCDCGKEKIICGAELKRGRSKSCGCLNKEVATKHGLRNHPLYRTWGAMKNRCYNKKSQDYHHYGDRGITVCDRWKNSFPAFLADMGEKPALNLSIDRIDNNGNYEPSNCRWATPAQQTQNSRLAKLTAPDVFMLRVAASSGLPKKTVGFLFGISPTQAGLIIRHKGWTLKRGKKA